jgi:tRNA uridine 5-carboxymethylaminomethyl modification enzyme
MELLRRPEFTCEKLMELTDFHPLTEDKSVYEQIEIQVKYEGYIARQALEIQRLMRHENIKLPKEMNYDEIKGLSTEVRQKLNEYRPETLGIASRIPGVTPAAISLLLVYLKKGKGISS